MKTRSRRAAPLPTLLAAGWAALLSGCAEEEVGVADQVGVAEAALSPSVAANLAHPEYDLNEPAGWSWMHATDAAGIQGRIAQGFRLVSVDTVTSSPLIFSAAFVSNAGVYFRAGHGFASGMTRQELDGLLDDYHFRVTDFAIYSVGGTTRYAAAWVSNTGNQQVSYWPILDATQAQFESKVAALNGRVTDVMAHGGKLHGLVIANQGDDFRHQTRGVGTRAQVVEAVATRRGRLADLEPWGTDTFYYVVEDLRGTVGEQTWWAADLTETTDKQNPDSLYHQTDRFGGRFMKLKGHVVGGQRLYYGWLADNGAVPMSGTSNAGNATLDKIDAAVSRAMKRAGVPGAALAVVRNGNLVHAKGYGMSDIAAGRVTQPTDMFRIASVSKTIANAAVLRLIQDNTVLPPGTPGAGLAFNLGTQPWGQVWRYSWPTGRPRHLGHLSVRHLLEHSTGLIESFEWKRDHAEFTDLEEDLGLGSFWHAPGQLDPDPHHRFYKNSHYHILGNAVAAITGGTFDQYVQRTFFEPLSIQRIRVAHPHGAADPPGLFQAVSYERPGRFARQFYSEGVLHESGADERGDWSIDGEHRHAASSYAASPVDLLKFAVSLDGSRPGVRALDDLRWNWIQTQQSPALVGTGRFLTWFGLPLNHGGYLPGVTHAHLRLNAANGVKYAFMSNSDSMTNLGTQQVNHESFEGILLTELEALFAAEAHLLPDRDLFDQYIPPPCHADFHDLPMASFQACYNHWTAKGLQPQTLSASPDGARMSGSFQAVSPRRTHHLLPAATYEAITQQEMQNGTMPNHVNVVNLGGDLRFTATWVSAGGAGFSTFWGMTPATFQEKFNQLYADHQLTDWFLYQDGGLKIAATWRKQAHGGYGAYYGLTWQSFNDLNDDFVAAGFRTTHFLAYPEGGQTLYTAIWRPVTGDWRTWISDSGAHYQGVWNQMTGQGYRLHQLHSHGADSFTSIWKRNTTE